MIVGTAVGDHRHDLASTLPRSRASTTAASAASSRDRFYLLAYRARIELERGRWTEATEAVRACLLPPPHLDHPAHLRARGARPRARPARRPRPGGAARRGVGIGRGTRGPVASVGTCDGESRGRVAQRRSRGGPRGDGWHLRALHRARSGAGSRASWPPGGVAQESRRTRRPTSRSRTRSSSPASGRAQSELWRELGFPYEAALALADADEEEPLRRALEELHQLGARPAAAIVARRLRKLGVRGLPRGPRPRR